MQDNTVEPASAERSEGGSSGACQGSGIPLPSPGPRLPPRLAACFIAKQIWLAAKMHLIYRRLTNFLERYRVRKTVPPFTHDGWPALAMQHGNRSQHRGLVLACFNPLPNLNRPVA
jgi:hypothetical protein